MTDIKLLEEQLDRADAVVIGGERGSQHPLVLYIRAGDLSGIFGILRINIILRICTPGILSV